MIASKTPAGSFPLFRMAGRWFALLIALLAACRAPAAESSELAPLAPKSLLLAVTRAGDTLVAVGDRGHVLRSADQGRTWTQSLTPTQALLTGVSFADARHGWAVGHDGVILATTDGGLTWQHQDNGKDLETVYLDVLFRDAQHGFAVGAYGKFMATADDGKTWTKLGSAKVSGHRLAMTVEGVTVLATASDDTGNERLSVFAASTGEWRPLISGLHVVEGVSDVENPRMISAREGRVLISFE